MYRFLHSIKKNLRVLVVVVFLVLIGQQCSDVQLEYYQAVSFKSLGSNPFRLSPPSDHPQIRRVVFFVDMSQSMVSGPCLHDVDSGAGFSVSPAHRVFDPNKPGVGNINDHRGDGIDCQVAPTLPIQPVTNVFANISLIPPTFPQAHIGNDYEFHRIKMLRKWIVDSLSSNTEMLIGNTKIMIVPFSGGISQTKLNNKLLASIHQTSLFKFYSMNDPILVQIIDWLEQEHAYNVTLSESDDVWRYENRTMGTSAPGALLPQLFKTTEKEMRALNLAGELAFTDFQYIFLTDGLITPIKENISNALSLFGSCSSSCINDPTALSCGTGLCGSLVQRMIDAWGRPDDNDLKNLDLNFGLIQALPAHFGAGDVTLQFVQLKKNRMQSAYPGKRTVMEQLEPYFNTRSAKLSVWQSDSEHPPVRLIGDSNFSESFQITNLYVLSPNARLNKYDKLAADSDGDGLFDDEESMASTDKSNPRSNGYCLDLFIANPAFAERCAAMADTNSCDPTLDSDGDELNECEEALIGTDPFDFDTDGDSIPDFYELIYNYNPLISDKNIDSNGDGFLNVINFASGLGPQHALKLLPADYYTHYEVNSKGSEKLHDPQFGAVSVELYELVVRHLPVSGGVKVPRQNAFPTYNTRVEADNLSTAISLRSYEERLISFVDSPYDNGLVALARMVDVSNPERAYWRLYKVNIPLSNDFKQPRLDLSLFRMIRAKDRNQ